MYESTIVLRLYRSSGLKSLIFAGDQMVILAEFGFDWYYGHTLGNEATKGIFPRSYVYVPYKGS